MAVSDRALIDAETLPLRHELYRLDVEQAVIDDWLQRLAVRTADIRARRKEIDRELIAVTSRINEGRAIRQRMGRR